MVANRPAIGQAVKAWAKPKAKSADRDRERLVLDTGFGASEAVCRRGFDARVKFNAADQVMIRLWNYPYLETCEVGSARPFR